MATSRLPRRSEAVRLFGYDVFVSFALGPAPRGTRTYASDLARRLRERDFTVFFSEDEAPVGGALDDTLKRALHRSRLLVVIANRATLEDPRWVRAEVEEFRRRHPGRAIVPISIDGALTDPALGDAAQAWLGFRGRIWVDETGEAGAAGTVSDAVIDRLATAPTAVRAAVLWRRLVAGVVVFFAALAGFSTWMGVRADRAARAERLAADQARASEGRASEAARREAEAASAAREAERVAVEQGRRALAGKLAAESRLRENRKPDLALLLAAQAQLLARTRETDDTLLSILASKRRLVAYLRPEVGTPRRIDFSADGRALAILGAGKIQVWDSERRAALGPPVPLEAFDIAYARDPRRLFALVYRLGYFLVVLDGSSGREIAAPVRVAEAGEPEPQLIAGIREADDDQVAIARSGGSLDVWALADGGLRRLPAPDLTEPHRERARTALRVRKEQRSADGSWQVTADRYSGDAYLSGPGPGGADPVREALIGHERGVPAVAFDPAGRFVATAGAEGQVLLWRLDGSVLTRWSAELPFFAGRAAFTRNGQLFVAGNQSTWALFDAQGRPVFVQRAIDGVARSGWPGISNQGDVVAERASLSSLRLRAAADGAPVGQPLVGKTGWVPRLIAFSPDDRLIAAGGQDNDVMVWERRSGELLAPAIKGHSGGYLHGLHTFAFSPDGQRLATGGRDSKIFLWDTASGRQLGEALLGHPGAVEALAFSPDGRLLAVGGETDRVTLYDLATRQALARRLSATNVGVVKGLAFSPRGDLLAGAGRQLTVWRLESGEPIFELDEGDRGVAFDREGTQLAVVGDKAVTVYELEPAHWIGKVCELVQRNLSCDEWTRHVGGEPYRKVCTALPGPKAC